MGLPVSENADHAAFAVGLSDITKAGAVLDTACTADLCGTQFLEAYEKKLKDLGLPFNLQELPGTAKFGFGGGKCGFAHARYKIPALPFGSLCYIICYAIRGSNPYLMSLSTMGRLGLVLDTPNRKLIRHGVEIEFKKTGSGHWLLPFLPPGIEKSH